MPINGRGVRGTKQPPPAPSHLALILLLSLESVHTLFHRSALRLGLLELLLKLRGGVKTCGRTGLRERGQGCTCGGTISGIDVRYSKMERG